MEISKHDITSLEISVSSDDGTVDDISATYTGGAIGDVIQQPLLMRQYLLKTIYVLTHLQLQKMSTQAT